VTNTATNPSDRILVIRLGALGDMVLCFQSFYEIRCAHPGAEIALLTMPVFMKFAQLMPWFDKVMIDDRTSGWRVDKWHSLVKEIRHFNPGLVYDLQGKFRQTMLYTSLGGPYGPEWSGAAPLCKYPRIWPPKPGMHFTDFMAAQLQAAHVPGQDPPDLSWLSAPLNHFSLPERYVLLIPGCAPGRDYKRWPAKRYADLALRLREKGIDSIVIGTKQDISAIIGIRQAAPHVIDLSNRTNLPEVASLARRSMAVIGNDTGPVHLAAAMGAPTLALISDRVDPVWSAPRGIKTRWLQGKPLDALGADEVSIALMKLAAS